MLPADISPISPLLESWSGVISSYPLTFLRHPRCRPRQIAPCASPLVKTPPRSLLISVRNPRWILFTGSLMQGVTITLPCTYYQVRYHEDYFPALQHPLWSRNFFQSMPPFPFCLIVSLSCALFLLHPSIRLTF